MCWTPYQPIQDTSYKVRQLIQCLFGSGRWPPKLGLILMMRYIFSTLSKLQLFYQVELREVRTDDSLDIGEDVLDGEDELNQVIKITQDYRYFKKIFNYRQTSRKLKMVLIRRWLGISSR